MSEYDCRIPCTEETRERLKDLKRGGEVYDDLLNKMVEQYNPDKGGEWRGNKRRRELIQT